MKVYFATDHAGYEMKEELLSFVKDELGYEVEDCGAFVLDEGDDYPDFIAVAAKNVSTEEGAKGIILGASGQGEAVVANRVPGVRAVVYYGEPQRWQTDACGEEMDMVVSTRKHNDANVLSLGARFLSIGEAKEVVKKWLGTEFEGVERHVRRINKIDS